MVAACTTDSEIMEDSLESCSVAAVEGCVCCVVPRKHGEQRFLRE